MDKQLALTWQPVPAEGLWALLLTTSIFWGSSLIHRQTRHWLCSAQFPLLCSLWRTFLSFLQRAPCLPSIVFFFFSSSSQSFQSYYFTRKFSHTYTTCPRNLARQCSVQQLFRGL